ncbi:MAG TPA: iron chelate uptake ABC transporter family permease subunit, partial [Ktedonobacterales bacterium]
MAQAQRDAPPADLARGEMAAGEVSLARSASRPRWPAPGRTALALVGLALALLVALALATIQGTVSIPPLTTLEIVLRHLGAWWIAPHWPATDDLIIMQVRLPRALGAALVGAALGVAGALFQGLLRNPLADPLLLGTSSGAALGAVVGLVVTGALTVDWLGFSLEALLAFVGALAAVVVVYALATRSGRTPVVT